MNYELKITETNNKSGKFHYQVIDENGTVISERKSNRVYAACTTNSGYYFGRKDLVGKGEHGSAIKHYSKYLTMSKYPFKNLYKGLQSEEESLKELQEDAKHSLNILNSIAYIN